MNSSKTTKVIALAVSLAAAGTLLFFVSHGEQDELRKLEAASTRFDASARAPRMGDHRRKPRSCPQRGGGNGACGARGHAGRVGCGAARPPEPSSSASAPSRAPDDPPPSRGPLEWEAAPSFEIARGVDPLVQPMMVNSPRRLPCDASDCDAGPDGRDYLIGYAGKNGVAQVTGFHITARGASAITSVPIAYNDTSSRFGLEPAAGVARVIERVEPIELVEKEGAISVRVVLTAHDTSADAHVLQCGFSDREAASRADGGAFDVTACHAAAVSSGLAVWTETETEAKRDGGAKVLGLERRFLPWNSGTPVLFEKVPPAPASRRIFYDKDVFVRGSQVHVVRWVDSPVSFSFGGTITGAALGGAYILVTTAGSPDIDAIERTFNDKIEQKKVEVPDQLEGCKARTRRVLDSSSGGVVAIMETCAAVSKIFGYRATAQFVSNYVVGTDFSTDAIALPFPTGTVGVAFAGTLESEQQPLVVAYVVREADGFVLRGMLLARGREPQSRD